MSALSVAHKQLAEARAALRTSIFKWSPDHVVAGAFFDRAAVSFKAAGDAAAAADAYLSAAESHAAAENDAAAAKSLESAGDLFAALAADQDSEEGIEAARASSQRATGLFSRSASLYRELGEAGRAAAVLSKQARALSDAAERLPRVHKARAGLEADALRTYLAACEVLETGGKLAFSLDTLRNTLNFAVKMERWKDALDVIDHMLPVYAQLKQRAGSFKLRLSKVVLQLRRNDLTAARSAFQEGFDDVDYLRSDECAAAEDLLKAWEQMDEDTTKAVLSRPIFNFLERQVSLVARSLGPFQSSVDAGALGAAPTAQAPTAAPPSTSEMQQSHGTPVEEVADAARDALFSKREGPVNLTGDVANLHLKESDETKQKEDQNSKESVTPPPPIVYDKHSANDDDDDLSFLR